MKVQIGDFMDMMGNNYDNIWYILGILRRWNLEDEFVFKAHSPRIVSQEEVTLRTLFDVNINILTYVLWS